MIDWDRQVRDWTRIVWLARAVLVLACLALALQVAHLASGASKQVPLNLPSKKLTPGWYNPEVKQSTIASTICVSGWTATIRPPESYTGWLKKAELRYRNLPGTVSDYEMDHFVPLELGGSSFDTRNLWMESHNGSSGSDPLENALHAKVCNGALTLKQAQAQIIAYKRAKG